MTLDFSGKNLRGRNFKGRQDLAGANFSYADIRGANFTNANLKGANFSHAKAGLQRDWAIFLVLVSCFLSGLSGFLWGLNRYLGLLIFSPDNQIVGWIVLIVLIAYFFITIHQGITAGLRVVAIAVVAVVFAFAIDFAGALPIFAIAIAVAGAGAFVIFAIAIAAASAVAGSRAVAVAIAGAFAGAIVGAIAPDFTLALFWSFFGVPFNTIAIAIPIFPVAFAAAATGTLFSIYISWRAMKGDEKHSLIRNIAIAFAATGGTSFRGADLTNADFTTATLKSTDFRNAILTNIHWHQAKMLDYVRLV